MSTKIFHLQRISQKKKNEIKRSLFVFSILMLPIAVFLVFWLYVNFDSILLSFQRETYSDGNMQLVFTLDNFKRVFETFFIEKSLFIAFKNTSLFYLVSVIVIFPISLLMAYFIYKKIYLHKFFRVVAYLPNIITSAALVALYKYTFMLGGPYDAILRAIGEEYNDPISGKSALLMLLIYNIIFGFGGNMVILGGAMNSVNADCLEAGQIDGCNWFQELWYLILPMIWPTISTMLILGFAGFMSATGPILAMTPNNTDTFSLTYVLYSYATGVGYYGQDIYYASAVGLVMTLVTFPLVILMRKLLNKVQED